MTLHWLDLALGTVVGTALGAFAIWKLSPILHRWSERRRLNREYHSLSGQYENFNIASGGAHEPTGETIELTWDPQQAVLEATALLANGFSIWHSYVSMSLRFKGTGTGHYNYVNSIHGGQQQLVYSRQAHSFHVMGVSNTRKPFLHYWVRKS